MKERLSLEEKLVNTILSYSAQLMDEILNMPKIIKQELIGTDEVQIVLYEFSSFFVFVTDLKIKNAYGREKCNEVIPLILAGIEAKLAAQSLSYLKENGYKVNDTVRETLRKNFYFTIRESGQKYSRCSSYFDEKTSALKRTRGESPTALVTVLIDNLNKQFNGEPVAFDLNFVNVVKERIFDALNLKQIDDIIGKMSSKA